MTGNRFAPGSPVMIHDLDFLVVTATPTDDSVRYTLRRGYTLRPGYATHEATCSATGVWTAPTSLRPARTSTTKPTTTQAEAIRRAIAATGRLIYLTGGFWTVDGCPSVPGRGVPEWSVTRGTITAMERRGWLLALGSHRDAPREVTEAGKAVVAAAGVTL